MAGSGRDLEYEINNRGLCLTNGINGIQCKNYSFCGSILPDWWYDCKGKYLCTGCHQQFGTWGDIHTGKGELDFDDDMTCPMCLATHVKCVSYARCDHKICLRCAKKANTLYKKCFKCGK